MMGFDQIGAHYGVFCEKEFFPPSQDLQVSVQAAKYGGFSDPTLIIQVGTTEVYHKDIDVVDMQTYTTKPFRLPKDFIPRERCVSYSIEACRQASLAAARVA